MAAAPGSNAPETASPSGLDLLPPEIIVKVLPHLDVQSVARYSQVNRRANKIVKEAPNHQPFWDRAQEVVCNQRESRRLSFEFGNWPLCMIDPISVAGWNYAEASHNLVKNVMGPCQKCGDRPTWLSALDGRYVCWDCFYVATLVASLNYIWVPTIFRTDTINRYDFGDFGVINRGVGCYSDKPGVQGLPGGMELYMPEGDWIYPVRCSMETLLICFHGVPSGSEDGVIEEPKLWESLDPKPSPQH